MTARNIEIVLGGLVDAVRYRDPKRIAGFLAPDLVGDGISPMTAGHNEIIRPERKGTT
jgi:hypothetical protein